MSDERGKPTFHTSAPLDKVLLKSESTERDNLELATLQAQADIEKSKANAVIADNNLKLKLAEANIASVEELIKESDRYKGLFLELERDRVATSIKQNILDGMLEKYDDLMNALTKAVEHQEQATNEANKKLADAESKLNLFNELHEKKCADCLRRDKSKCDKCNYKKFCENIKRNDYRKWLERLEE